MCYSYSLIRRGRFILVRFNAGDHIVSKSEKAELFEFSFYSIATCLVLFFLRFRKSKQAVRTNENLVEKTASRAPENIQVVAQGKAELPAEGEKASADIESSQTMDESTNEENVNVEKGEGVGDLVAVEEEPSIPMGNNQEITDENQENTEDAAVSEKEDNAADIDLAKMEDVDASGKKWSKPNPLKLLVLMRKALLGRKRFPRRKMMVIKFRMKKLKK